MFCQNQVQSGAWDYLPAGLLDGVETMLELSECTGSTIEETMKNVRLVNRH